MRWLQGMSLLASANRVFATGGESVDVGGQERTTLWRGEMGCSHQRTVPRPTSPGSLMRRRASSISSMRTAAGSTHSSEYSCGRVSRGRKRWVSNVRCGRMARMLAKNARGRGLDPRGQVESGRASIAGQLSSGHKTCTGSREDMQGDRDVERRRSRSHQHRKCVRERRVRGRPRQGDQGDWVPA